jgi:hypothetical protein
MTPLTRRRIVRRAVMALAGVVLVVASYVGWWCLYNWGRSNAVPVAGSRDYSRYDWLFAPLIAYSGADHVGSDALRILDIWAWSAGRLSWEECRSVMQEEKTEGRNGYEPVQ